METSVSSQDKAPAVGAAMRRLTAEIDGLDQRAASRFGINRSDLRCLDVLRGVGPTTPTTLAGAVGMTTGGLSLALDRLESAGYVTRRPNANDRRSVIVEPTEHLAQVEREIFGPLVRGMGEIIAHPANRLHCHPSTSTTTSSPGARQTLRTPELQWRPHLSYLAPYRVDRQGLAQQLSCGLRA